VVLVSVAGPLELQSMAVERPLSQELPTEVVAAETMPQGDPGV
jgi:hypothetical protein